MARRHGVAPNQLFTSPQLVGQGALAAGSGDKIGSCVVEFRTAEGDVLVISIPKNEIAVIRHF